MTTAIAYTNGVPHIGHAYEAVVTDVIARHQRQRGRQVYLLTGADESPMPDATHTEINLTTSYWHKKKTH